MSGSRERADGRRPDELRPVEILIDHTKWAEGSVLCSFGDTRVLCNVSIEERVPGWLRDGTGWITAEYAMLPRATDRRNQRESVRGKRGGRTHEISRLIGRATRAAVNLAKLGERTLTVDCDVLQADGGTRTVAITGAWVAIRLAVNRLLESGTVAEDPVMRQVAAVSLGVFDGEVLLDLDYREDQKADTDLNLIMTDGAGIVEVQGTAEKAPFSKPELDRMLEIGGRGIGELLETQKRALN